MKPLVSVLVPMYNHAHYIPYTLRSMQQQTYGNFECIVMDDGSTDDGAKIVTELSAQDARFRLLSQPNGGLVSALNGLFAACQGKYVTTLDADDCFLPSRLADGVADLDANPQLSVSFCGVETIDGTGERTNARLELVRHALEGQEFYNKLVCHNFVASCAGFIRRERLDEVGLFARPVGLIPDWDLWLRLAARGEMALREKVGVQVRWDGQNMSSRSIRESAAQHIAVSRELAQRVCARHKIKADVRAAICDMRIAWAKCVDNHAEVIRALGEKRNITRLSDNDWALFVRVLVSRGNLAQAHQYLRELTVGRLSREVSDEARGRLAMTLARFEQMQNPAAAEQVTAQSGQ